MEHVIVKLARLDELDEMREWLRSTRDGELFDYDVLEHESTFVLQAMGADSQYYSAYLPVQQPFMLESLVCRPGLTASQTAQALTRLSEYAISEAFRRDAGEIYFLTRDADTAKFAERHKFKPLPDGLKVYRLNLRETFGIS